ncbi:hypothetical protein ACFL36_05840, partial [Thermodesulfobacteriota bacterium]
GGIGKVVDQAEVIEEEPAVDNINFNSGHVERSEADVVVKKAKPKLRATLLHNKIQNKLYKHLCENYPPDTIGTENDCGIGMPVDVVRNDNGSYIFYEIKTNKSVRICIRQALSQLLEYSCWPNQNRAEQLIIVSQNPITNQATQYIEHLRDEFDLPVFYQQFDLEDEELKTLY